MRRTLRTLLSAAVLVAAAPTALAAPAHADTGPLVLYTDSLFEGYPLTYWHSDPAMSYGTSDKASSVRNYDNVAWVLFDDKHYQDRRYCIRPGEEVALLGVDGLRFNDKISSVYQMPTADCGRYPAFYSR